MLNLNKSDEVWFSSQLTYKKYAFMTIVNQACYSAGMMPHNTDVNLGGHNRILISATDREQDSYTESGSYKHWAFLHEGRHTDIFGVELSHNTGFTLNLGAVVTPQSISHAFNAGYNAARYNYVTDLGFMVHDYRSSPEIINEDVADCTYL